VNFAAITLCVVSQRVFIVVVYFVIDSIRKLLDTPLYLLLNYAPCHEAVWSNGRIPHAFLTSPIRGGGWSASRPGRSLDMWLSGL
jgi:hypothetical protein